MGPIADRFHGLRKPRRSLVLVLLGVVAALGQAPLGWWWATVLSLALVIALMRGIVSARDGFVVMWLVGFGYAGFALRWIVSPFLVDVASTGWMAPFGIALMAAGVGVFWGLAGAVAAGRGVWALVAALTLTEAVRSLILTGFPWALIGHVWVGTPIAQAAAFVGPHGLTLITLVLAALLAGRRTAAVAGVAGLVAGFVALNPGAAGPADGPLIRIVQPNVPQDEKWDPDLRERNFQRTLDLTSAAPVPDLIVWPETAIPVLMDYAQSYLDDASEAARGAPLILGINRSDGPLFHNSLILMGQGAQVIGTYDKSHLAPFGEYIPGGEWLTRFGIHGLAASTGNAFSPGGLQPLMAVPGVGDIRPLICYEGIFAEEIGREARPRAMVLITNDAWFGNGAGPTQHLAQARLRAIEQAVPMVRAANTGISAMIDAKGRIIGALPLNSAGALDERLPEAGPATYYARIGDGPVLGAGLLILMLSYLRRQKNWN